MAKEVAIGKRAKISKAQQYTLFAVLGAGIFLGIAISLIKHFTNQISFNANVIAEEDKSLDEWDDFARCVAKVQETLDDEEVCIITKKNYLTMTK